MEIQQAANMLEVGGALRLRLEAKVSSQESVASNQWKGGIRFLTFHSGF